MTRNNSIDQFQLRNLPTYGKLFVALFTTLMLLVIMWAALIYLVEKGRVTVKDPLAYMKESAVEQRERDIEAILADPNSVLAPIWDSIMAGREAEVDSISLAIFFAKADSILSAQRTDSLVQSGPYRYAPRSQEHFRRNVGLAHTHINGQTLLYFAIGLIFLFSSAAPKTKKIIYWLFGVSIVLHVVGLTGEGFGSAWDDLLAISGVVLLVMIAYMAFVIYMDLGKKPIHLMESRIDAAAKK